MVDTTMVPMELKVHTYEIQILVVINAIYKFCAFFNEIYKFCAFSNFIHMKSKSIFQDCN